MYSLHRGAPDRAKSATACIMALRVAYKIILEEINLAILTATTKLIPRQIFQLYGIPEAPDIETPCYKGQIACPNNVHY